MGRHGYTIMRLSDRIGCRLKLNDLHVLMVVVNAGSMSKAAALLNTGQPAISRSIAELEHALGVRLLDRNRQGVKPTAYGYALLDGGTAVFDELRQTVKSISFLADPTVGEVTVGCNPFLAASFVSTVIDRLSRRLPRAVFRLTPAYAEAQHRALIERNTDFLIARRSGSLVADQRLDYEFLFNDTYAVAVGAKNAWARHRSVELAELVNEPWTLPPSESTTGSVALAAFQAIGLDYPRTTVIAEPVDVRIRLLATGRFITIFPQSVFRFSALRKEMKVLPTKQSFRTIPVGIITLKGRTISPLAQHFTEGARQAARQFARVKQSI
jgi:DNA-binding transcriptional LysR family regulator